MPTTILTVPIAILTMPTTIPTTILTIPIAILTMPTTILTIPIQSFL